MADTHHGYTEADWVKMGMGKSARPGLLIAFTGLAGSGKSRALEEAKKVCNRPYVVVKFADPLKDMLRAFYERAGEDPETIERKMEGDLKEQPCKMLAYVTPRRAMQTLGTEWGRSTIHQAIWTRAYLAKVHPYLDKGFLVLTDDCRFDNEVEAIRSIKGTTAVIRVKPALDNIRSPGDHISEKGVSDVDWEFTNPGTTVQLNARVWEVLNTLGLLH
jgi:hypothetical protein